LIEMSIFLGGPSLLIAPSLEVGLGATGQKYPPRSLKGFASGLESRGGAVHSPGRLPG
jgi:hypothetical protein